MLLFLAKIVAHKLIIPNAKLVVKVQMTFPWLQFNSEWTFDLLSRKIMEAAMVLQNTKNKEQGFTVMAPPRYNAPDMTPPNYKTYRPL